MGGTGGDRDEQCADGDAHVARKIHLRRCRSGTREMQERERMSPPASATQPAGAPDPTVRSSVQDSGETPLSGWHARLPENGAPRRRVTAARALNRRTVEQRSPLSRPQLKRPPRYFRGIPPNLSKGIPLHAHHRICAPATLLLIAAVTTSWAKVKLKILPALGYSTDEGMGLGLRVDIAKLAADSTERMYLSMESSFSTAGRQSHYFFIDLPRALTFAGRPLHTTAKLGYARALYENYFGQGNDTRRSDRLTEQHYYSYERRYPYARGSAGYPLVSQGRWTLLVKAGLFGEYDRILQSKKKPRDGVTPLLFQDRPAGVDGGVQWGAMTGLTLDSRDSQKNPTRGVFVGVLTHLVPSRVGARVGDLGARVPRHLRRWPAPDLGHLRCIGGCGVLSVTGAARVRDNRASVLRKVRSGECEVRS